MAIIQNPETEEEKLFNIPLATESFFENFWEPLAEELELQWIPAFLSGIDICNDDLDDIFSELDKLEILAKKKLNHIEFEQLDERINILREKLPDAFKRNNAIIFIG